MTFIDAINKWFKMIFDMIGDGFELIFSYDWTAFAFVAVFVIGLLCMIAGLFTSVRETVFGIRQSSHGMTTANRSLNRALWLDRRAMEKEVTSIKRAQLEEERKQRQAALDQRRMALDQRRSALDSERAMKKRVQEGREKYAQMLLNTSGYEDSRFVTIEGKRYYRKGLISKGQKMKSSDKDFSSDLEDIDNNSRKGDET